MSTVIFIGWLAWIETREFEALIIAQNQKQLLSTARSEARYIAGSINDMRSQLEIYALSPTIKRSFSEKVRESEIAENEYHPAYDIHRHVNWIADSVYRIDSKGMVLGRAPFKEGREGTYFSKKPGVKYVLENHKSYISEVFITNSGAYSISVCVPVLAEGNLIGVLRSLLYLATIGDKLIPVNVGEKGYVQLLDDEGKIMINPNSAYVGQDMMALRRKEFPNTDWSELEDIAKKMTSGYEGTGIYHSAKRVGKKTVIAREVIAFAPLRMGNKTWSMVITLNYDEIAAPIKRHAINTFIVTAIIILIIIAVSIIIYRFQKKKEILNATSRSAEILKHANQKLEREVEERRKMEEKNRKQGEYLHTIINSLSHPFYVIDANDYTIKIANSAAREKGVSEASTCHGLTHKQDTPCQSAEHPCPLSEIKKTKKPMVVEHIHYDKDGNSGIFEVHGFPIFDDEGDVIQMIEYSMDITDKKEAEKELWRTKGHLDNLIESSLDCIMVSDRKGYITRINKYFLELLNYREEQVLGKHVMEFTPMIEGGTFESSTGEFLQIAKEYVDNANTMISMLLERGKVTNWETYYFRNDKKVVPVEQNIVILTDSLGNRTGAVAIIRDITERKKMEKQLLQSEKLRSLGELAGGVAHDFNNVLAAIIGRAQLLKIHMKSPPGIEDQRKSTHDLKKSVEVIERAARDGAETVRRIQEFARRREDDKHFTQVDINMLIEDALEFTQAKWKDGAELKGIKITIKKEFSPVPTISGSAAELREVFTNLINNALDAMPQGGTITTKTCTEGSHISIKVEDTGYGIPKPVMNRIFDPFFTTKGVQSTGLGMSVSYGIINRHQGAITVDSVEGQGTTFLITLPVSEKAVEKEKAIDTMPMEQMKAKILVIEDDEEVREILSEILLQAGHEVEVATEGTQGVEMFSKKAYDMVVTDLGMPGISGWEVAEKVKGINGKIPVAVITGWNIQLDGSEMKRKGIDLIINKPFEINQVLGFIQEGLLLGDQLKAV